MGLGRDVRKANPKERTNWSDGEPRRGPWGAEGAQQRRVALRGDSRSLARKARQAAAAKAKQALPKPRRRKKK